MDDALNKPPVSEPSVPPPTALDVQMTWMHNGDTVHIKLHVEGKGDAARQAAAELSTAVARLVVPAPAPTAANAVESVAVEVAENAPTLGTARDSAFLPKLSPAASASASPMQAWFRQNRERINKVVGSVLLALAVLVPVIVPVQQRSEVLVMTILFALTGALLWFTAMLPSRSQAMPSAASMADQPLTVQPPTPAPSTLAARRRELLKPARQTIGPGWGLALGGLFVVAGLVAPFALGTTSADERFVIMLGFAPVTVVGFFMIAIFGRSYWLRLMPSGTQAEPTMPKATAPTGLRARAPVGRVPQNFEYRAIVPVAIVALLAIMAVVVGLVIYATVSSVTR